MQGEEPLLARTHPWEPWRESHHTGRYQQCLSWAMLLMVASGKVKCPSWSYAKCVPGITWFAPHFNPLR